MPIPLRVLVTELLTAGAAVISAYVIYHGALASAVAQPPRFVELPPGQFIANPAEDPLRSRLALTHALKSGDQVVFGSSEMTETAPVALQTNFPKACGRRVLTLGRAGFQSLPIALTLAEYQDVMGPQSRVAVILSPGWFAERGTPSEAFLRFLPPFQLARLYRRHRVHGGLERALAREIRIHRDEFTGLYPDWLYPAWSRLAGFTRARQPDLDEVKIDAPQPEAAGYDWEREERLKRDEAIQYAAGNAYGVTPEFFDKIKSQALPKPAPRLDPYGVEKEDLAALSELLRERGVRATFIVQPIHRRIYKDLEPYDALFASLEGKLKEDGHRVVSYFREPFDLTVLKDTAHFTEASWIRVARELCQ